jgi:hypothetical protein
MPMSRKSCCARSPASVSHSDRLEIIQRRYQSQVLSERKSPKFGRVVATRRCRILIERALLHLKQIRLITLRQEQKLNPLQSWRQPPAP